MSKDYNKRFNVMLKYLGITRVHVSKITGLSHQSVKNATISTNFSRWAKMIVWVFEEMKTKLDKK